VEVGGVGSAKGGLELTQAGQRALTVLFALAGVPGRGRRWWGLGWRGWTQAQAADLEVFLEAVGLKEVGEFEGADVTALGADLALEVGDDGAEFLAGVTGAQEFEPPPFAVEAQAEGLAGELAVELVGPEDGGGIDRSRRWCGRSG
jgi:hypothetical protein